MLGCLLTAVSGNVTLVNCNSSHHFCSFLTIIHWILLQGKTWLSRCGGTPFCMSVALYPPQLGLNTESQSINIYSNKNLIVFVCFSFSLIWSLFCPFFLFFIDIGYIFFLSIFFLWFGLCYCKDLVVHLNIFKP